MPDVLPDAVSDPDGSAPTLALPQTGEPAPTRRARRDARRETEVRGGTGPLPDAGAPDADAASAAPDEPGTPDEPAVPAEPGTPDEPAVPAEPGTSDEPKASGEPGAPDGPAVRDGSEARDEPHERTENTEHDEPAEPGAWRAWLAVAALACALAALAAAFLGTAGPAVLPLLLIAPGLVVASWVRTSGIAAAALVLPASAAALMVASSVSLWLGVWNPAVGTILLAAAAGVLASVRVVVDRRLLVARRRRTARRGAQRTPSASVVGRVLLGGAGLLAWLLALPAVRSAETSPWGLLTAGQPLLLLALAVPVVLLVWGVRAGSVGTTVAATALAVLAFRTTGALTDEVPRYAWTYKHIGATDAIMDTGTLFPGLDIYQQWPAFFSASAWISEATGVAPITLATWITPVITVVMALVVAYLAAVVGAGPLARVVAAFLATVLTWVGQDYFAPQSIATPLAVAVLALALVARRRPSAGAAALALFAALVCAHQLTPVWVLIALWALVVVRRAPFWIAPLATVLFGAFLALRIEVVERYGVISDGGLLANAATNIEPTVSPAQELLSAASRGSAVVLWATAAILVVVMMVRRRPWLAVSIVAFSPVALLGMQDYGGEAIIRVYLYSMAGCAAIIAPWLTRALRARWYVATAATAALALAVALAAHSYFASWFVYRMTAAQVHVSEVLFDQAPEEVMFMPAIGNWPERSTGAYIDRLQWWWAFDRSMYMDELAGTDLSQEEQIAQIEQRLDDVTWVPAYVIITGSMEPYAQLRGLYLPGAMDNLAAALTDREGWDHVVTEGDVKVFRYAPGTMTRHPGAAWTWPAEQAG
ncbi:hypothetical protein AOA12_17810 [Microbacterium sp. No. 7]|nr:hypothetical protein AOA12_17810 [Microbacterium sp. No. 7]